MPHLEDRPGVNLRPKNATGLVLRSGTCSLVGTVLLSGSCSKLAPTAYLDVRIHGSPEDDEEMRRMISEELEQERSCSCVWIQRLRTRPRNGGLQGTGHQDAQEKCCLRACASVESRPPGLEGVQLLGSISLDELQCRISSGSKEDVSDLHEEVPEEDPDPVKDPHKFMSLDSNDYYRACQPSAPFWKRSSPQK